MSINPLSFSLPGLLSETPVTSKTGTAPSQGGFSDVFTELMNTVKETDKQDKASAVELLTGQADDMSGLLLDAQKAEIALNLSLQVRSKILDAYNEIMRMQV